MRNRPFLMFLGVCYEENLTLSTTVFLAALSIASSGGSPEGADLTPPTRLDPPIEILAKQDNKLEGAGGGRGETGNFSSLSLVSFPLLFLAVVATGVLVSLCPFVTTAEDFLFLFPGMDLALLLTLVWSLVVVPTPGEVRFLRVRVGRVDEGIVHARVDLNRRVVRGGSRL